MGSVVMVAVTAARVEEVWPGVSGDSSSDESGGEGIICRAESVVTAAVTKVVVREPSVGRSRW